MQLCEGLENATGALFTKLDLTDAAWKLGGASNVTEAKSFYLQLDDGSTLIYQIAFTNVAWPTDWFQVNAHYLPASLHSVDDKGRIEHCDNVSKFWAKITKDKLGVDASTGSIHIKCEQDIRLKLKCGKIRFEINLADSVGLVTLGDGCINVPKEGQVRIFFLPNLKGEGTLKIKDKAEQKIRVKGIGIIQWQGIKVHRYASKWTLGWFQSPEIQIISMQLQGTKRLEHQKLRLNLVVQDGKINVASIEGNLESKEITATHKAEMMIKGKDVDGKDVVLEVREDALKQLTRIKVLDNVPFLVRKVLQAFMSSPVISHFESTSATLLRDGGQIANGSVLLEESIILKGDQ